MREALIQARRKKGWTQKELGQRVGLPQTHISGIETGRVIPRYDTLIELVRVLEYDLMLVPRELIPAVQSLVREQRDAEAGEEERPLYALDDEEGGLLVTEGPRMPKALGVHLHGELIGVITGFAGDKQVFALEQDYIENEQRPILSLSLKGRSGGVVSAIKPVHRRVPPFFSNLLPEGHLRT